MIPAPAFGSGLPTRSSLENFTSNETPSRSLDSRNFPPRANGRGANQQRSRTGEGRCLAGGKDAGSRSGGVGAGHAVEG